MSEHTYGDWHKRLRRSRGRAVNFTCSHCDKQADEWAYDGTDPEELIGPKGMRFSFDQDRYIPLCYTCHSAFDRPKQDNCPRCGSPYARDSYGWARCMPCRHAARAARGEMKRPGIGRAGDRTHCPKGHPYDEENTRINRHPDGSFKQRACRECGRQNVRARRARLKAGDAQ